ncbi:MAG: shikimate dehydrogenase [Candidatus Syntrophoarchaeum sp. WYZ-LMO15]|nr:MAG: shikimate dehydrogenase [Candidatus Syntrophoarchaeum sp. WYZ-LMO15]
MIRVFGVIGDPIGHSLSPVMHNAAYRALGLECTYIPFRVDRKDLPDAIRGAKALGIQGLNVTVPHKEAVMELVDPDPLAERIGAVNTIDLLHGKGYNTDAIGIKRSLEEEGLNLKGACVLLLGAGGAARAAAFSCLEGGARLIISNRTRSRGEKLASELGGSVKAIGLERNEIASVIPGCDILINTTSVGMYPEVDKIPIDPDLLHKDLIVFDIVYNPPLTGLLREAKQRGCKTIDGVKMLVYQGAASFKIWFGFDPPVDVMEGAVRSALRDKEVLNG